LSIANFSELQTAVADWIGNRASASARIKDFIMLFETQFSRDMRTQNQFKNGTFAPGIDGAVTLPADFSILDAVTVSSGADEVNLTPATIQYAKRFRPSAGIAPRFFYIQAGKLFTAPVGPGNVTIHYYAKLPALTDAATTNWLLTGHPDVYLYGSLLQSAPFIQDAEMLTYWGSAYQAASSSLELSDTDRWSGGQSRIVGISP